YVSGDGGENRIFSEFNETNFTFSIGQHPGRCKAGDVYRVRQAMVYSPGGGEKFTATFEFNITITP
ncbi:MAG: DUF4859 domain-containing protein, partial [Bacteroidales bacterium]